MTQLNVELPPETHLKIAQLMADRGLKSPDDLVRVLIAEAVVPKKVVEADIWEKLTGAGLRGGTRPREEWLTEDDLYAKPDRS